MYDVVIIGAGSMGMAAGYYLSEAGQRVLLIDAHDPPHTNGSHHGETRIIRHAYGEGENYVPLALRAQKLWEELEEKSKETLFLQTGVLNIGAPDSPFIQNVIKSAEQFSLLVETYTATEVNEKWPGFQLPAELIGCFESESGVLMSERCIQVYRELALNNGAILQMNTRVESIEVDEAQVTVKTPEQTFIGKHLIVTAGKGTNEILSHLGLKLPLQPVRKTFAWFDSTEDTYAANTFPAFTANIGEEMYYGFPSIDGAGIKVGRNDGGQPVTADEPLVAFGTYEEDEQDPTRLTTFLMSEKMPQKYGKTCVYTNTPDSDFIIDRHPKFDHVVFACGFSGHGYKFSSVVGETLSQFIVANESTLDVSNFSIDRFER